MAYRVSQAVPSSSRNDQDEQDNQHDDEATSATGTGIKPSADDEATAVTGTGIKPSAHDEATTDQHDVHNAATTGTGIKPSQTPATTDQHDVHDEATTGTGIKPSQQTIKPSSRLPRPSKAPVMTSDDESIAHELPVIKTDDEPNAESDDDDTSHSGDDRFRFPQRYAKHKPTSVVTQEAASSDSDVRFPRRYAKHKPSVAKQEAIPKSRPQPKSTVSDMPKPKSTGEYMRLRVRRLAPHEIKEELESNPEIKEEKESEDNDLFERDNEVRTSEDDDDLSQALVVEIYVVTGGDIDVTDVYDVLMVRVAERGSIMAHTVYASCLYVKMRTPAQAQRVMFRTNKVHLAKPRCIELR